MLDYYWVIVGAGKTGLSVARYLDKQSHNYYLIDENTELSPRPEVKHLVLGKYDETMMKKSVQIVLSPGVDPNQAIFQRAKAFGVELVNDMEFFAKKAKAPIIAITGSNGKSTVTSLVASLLKASGLKVELGGNIGIPVLDLLEKPAPDYYVLEISSYQLELLESLKAYCAVVLNVTPDHLARHGEFENYRAIKNKIYNNCRHSLANIDDRAADTTFSDNGNTQADFYMQDGFLKKHGHALCHQSDLKLAGNHNAANALVAIAICDFVGVKFESYKAVLMNFEGLPHRCQLVAQLEGVSWINDSKATNVDATLTALSGIEQEIVLILGGQKKHDDYGKLKAVIKKKVKAVLLIGETKEEFKLLFQADSECCLCDSLAIAVAKAKQIAVEGDCVLLSPACASFDMFANFEERGEAFVKAIKGD